MESELMVEAVDVLQLPPVQVAAVASGLRADAGNYAPRTGDTRAAHELILSCLPLVDSIARRMHGSLPPSACVELHDLAQSGLLGLVSAGRNYEPSAAVPFSIYARYRIEGEMLDSLRRQDLAPRKLRRWQKQVSAARQELTASLQRLPTEEELCDRLMVSAVEMRSRTLELSRANAPLPDSARTLLQQIIARLGGGVAVPPQKRLRTTRGNHPTYPYRVQYRVNLQKHA